jgi:hypothetical protein
MEPNAAELETRDTGTETTRFGSGFHEECADCEFESPDAAHEPEIETPRVGDAQQADTPVGQQAFVGPDGQVHEIPPELIGPDGKMLPFNERTMRMLRGKYFTVRHVYLQDCDHKIDMTNQPGNNCQNCWFNWFNTHGKLVDVTHELFKERGKAALVAIRGARYTKMYFRFMSTVQHFLAEQKAQEANGEKNNPRGVNDSTPEETAEI